MSKKQEDEAKILESGHNNAKLKKQKQKHKRKKLARYAYNLLVTCLLIGMVFLALYVMKKARQLQYGELAEGIADFQVPEETGEPYVVLHDNIPYFDPADYSKDVSLSFSDLDLLGRCGVAFAILGKESLPTDNRGEIGSIKPTGWHTVKYPEVIPDRYLYNRCHLIAWCLSGENANEKNLITGTRYLNVEGMLPFEEQVVSYIERTGNHVAYRVTPIFEGRELLARGVIMEAYSIEDQGKGVTFCVFCFNCQPGIAIDYQTGDSKVAKQ